MYSKHILICDDDIKRYPPIISNINVLVELNVEVIVFGYCSDKNLLEYFNKVGVKYHPTAVDKVEAHPIKKWVVMQQNKKAVLRFLENRYQDKNTLVWVFGNENSWRLHQVIKKYRSVIYLFEFPQLKITPKYRLVVPFLNIKKLKQQAYKVVCCEYNRARITQAYFDLPQLPEVIENKPYLLNDTDLSHKLDQYITKQQLETLKTKKVVLYQGGGLIKNQNILDPVCEAVLQLDESFVFCIMASNNDVKQKLLEKYTNNKRILFLPFIPPPIHLEVTKLAHIGVLSYQTYNSSIQVCINLLYCAPNKIFEYSKYGVPMLSNKLPALEFSFSTYNCGICANFEIDDLKESITMLSKNHQTFSNGALKQYESFDLKKAIIKLISYKMES